MTDINSALPGVIHYGVKDESTRVLPTSTEDRPQCIPLFYLVTQKGPVTREYGSSSQIIARYGADSFDSNKPFYNFQTRLYNKLSGVGINAVVQRVVDPKVTVKANIQVYLDVIKTKLPNYKRNSSGVFVTEEGKKVLDAEKPLVDGYMVKWYKTSKAEAITDLGGLSTQEGTMVKWTFPEGSLHLVKSETNVDDESTGLTDYADKTVYVYESIEDIFKPSNGTTKRMKYVVDGVGSREDGVEETLGVTEDVSSKSTLYPIFEAIAPHIGSWYNQVGFGIESLLGSSVNSTIVSDLLSMPYRLYMYTKSTPKSSPSIFRNLSGDSFTDFTFKEGAVNPVTNAKYSFEEATEFSFYNEIDPNIGYVYKDMEPIHFYRSNFDNVLKQIMALEKEFVTDEIKQYADNQMASTSMWYDFTTTDKDSLDAEYGLVNPFTCKTSSSVPYFTVQYDTNQPVSKEGFKELNLTALTPIFLENGVDGNISLDEYEEFIRSDLARYADENDVYMDISAHPETFLFDNGFKQETKRELRNFIARRKNTYILSTPLTEADRGTEVSISDQQSIGSGLVSVFRMYQESEQFNTPTIRAAVICGDGLDISTKERIPLVEDISVKIVRLMGGTSKDWNPDYIFDKHPRNIISDYVDIRPKEIPENLKVLLFNSKLNYPQSVNVDKTYFFPALQSVYTNETSINNSMINSLAIPYCDTVAHLTWLRVTGDMTSTNEVFKKNVSDIANDYLKNAFGGILSAVAECEITDGDKTRGFTWHLNITLLGNVMKTKQITQTLTRRSGGE